VLRAKIVKLLGGEKELERFIERWRRASINDFVRALIETAGDPSVLGKSPSPSNPSVFLFASQSV